MNDRLVEDYRDVITSMILSNKVITDILMCGKEDKTDIDGLLWKNLVPQKYVPETLTDAQTHIMYDIDEDVLYRRDSSRETYVTAILYIWIWTHKNAPICDGILKHDIVAYELKRMLTGNKKLGIAPAKLIYDRHDLPDIKEYAGRLLCFNVTDWGEHIRAKYEKLSKD